MNFVIEGVRIFKKNMHKAQDMKKDLRSTFTKIHCVFLVNYFPKCKHVKRSRRRTKWREQIDALPKIVEHTCIQVQNYIEFMHAGTQRTHVNRI